MQRLPPAGLHKRNKHVRKQRGPGGAGGESECRGAHGSQGPAGQSPTSQSGSLPMCPGRTRGRRQRRCFISISCSQSKQRSLKALGTQTVQNRSRFSVLGLPLAAQPPVGVNCCGARRPQAAGHVATPPLSVLQSEERNGIQPHRWTCRSTALTKHTLQSEEGLFL